MPRKYEWLLFDADDTLLDFKLGEKRAITTTFENAGLPTDDDVIETYSRINDNLWKMLERGEVTKDRLKVLRFVQFCEHYGFNRDGAALAEAYVENLKKQTVLLDGAEDVCRALYGKYKMYIITNGIEAVQKARFGGCAIKDYFEKCYISDAIGVAKPVSVMVDTFGTGKVDESLICEKLTQLVDLRPAALIKRFDLRKPIYAPLAAYGHLGREELNVGWEKTDIASELASLL